MNLKKSMSIFARTTCALAATAGIALAGPRDTGPAGAHGFGDQQWQRMLPSQDDMPEGAATGEGQSDFRTEQTDRQTHSLDIGPNGVLELKNVSGEITVVAGSGRVATVEVLRRSRGRDDASAKLGLTEVRVDVDHQGERAAVTAVYPQRNRPPYSVTVSYTVTAPAGTRLTASSVSGDVSVRGVTGNVVAASVSGDVHVSNGAQVVAKSVSGDVTAAALNGGDVGIASVSGDLKLDDVRAQRLNAETVSGSVLVTRATSAGVNLKSVSGDIDFDGVSSRGGRYEFQSHSGDVTARFAGPAGFELQASTFSGDLRAEPAVLVKSSSTSRGSLRGTIGDGSATVRATTFSGSVTVTMR
jgi:DUF4097 and DUF4098 domain-containing protein YvlB